MFYLMPVELQAAELMIDVLSRRLHGPAACLKSRMVWLREASGQVWQTASNSITQLTAYLCNISLEMWSWSPIPCFYKEASCREKLELCRIKRTGTAKYTYSAKQGGSPLVNQELGCGVSVFSLHCRLLTCFSLSVRIRCHIQDLDRPFFRCTNKSWHLLLETMQ